MVLPRRSLSLLCHPASACPAVETIEVELAPTAAGAIQLGYRLKGRLAGIRVPAPQSAGFVDGLWQHTCFEIFVAEAHAPAYREFNFSPSGQWAAYGFSGYRRRDESFRPVPAPAMTMRSNADRLELDVILAPALLPSGSQFQLGLSAVVEAADGSLSYWALAHPSERPDFHHRDAFTLDLAIPATRI